METSVMCKNYRFLSGLVFMVAVLGFAIGAQAETVLFTDNFNGAVNNGAGNDYGLNDNLVNRQAGATLGAIQWDLDKFSTDDSIQVNHATKAVDMLLLQNTDTTTNNNNFRHAVLVQHDFATDSEISAAGGYTVRFDVNPMTSGIEGQENRGAQFFMGVKDGTQSYASSVSYISAFDSHSDFGIMFKNNGYLDLMGVPGYGTEGAYDDTRAGNYDRMYTVELRVETADFASNTSASVTLWIGDVGTSSELLTQVDLDVSDTTTMAATFNWDADGTCYMGLSPYFPRLDAYAIVDNFSVFTAEVPEPSTMALMICGLAGLLAYAWRKRK